MRNLLLLLLLNITGVFCSQCLAQQTTSSTVLAPREADSLFFNFKYKDALRRYNDFIRTSPDPSPITLARMAFCDHFLGNYQDAITLYNTVLEKQVSRGLRAQLYSRMAMTYSMKKNKAEALRFLDSAKVNGYFNTYEMENFRDFDFIRKDEKFREIYKKVYINAFPCASIPATRQFDFWVGEWDVFNNQFPNQRVGTSSIQNVSGGCTILENWQSYNNPYTGKSQNWYDTTTKKWTQLWIGAGGRHQYFTDGEYKDGAMRFKYESVGNNGAVQTGNFIFYNLGPDKVRQYQDVTNDGGKTYQVVYDFIYIRKGKGENKSS
jgi:hypothetical protein